MSYVLTTPPTAEPVSLTEAKLHLRVDFTDDDLLIGALISAARQYAEMVTQRQFVTATWMLVLDSFPNYGMTGVQPSIAFGMPKNAIILNKAPIVSVTSIQYLDMAGVLQTMDPAAYAVDYSTEPARITPKFGMIWPISLPQIGAVQINFIAGYGTPDGSQVWHPQQVPEGIKAWIKIRIGSLYENREEVALMTRGKLQALPFVDGLLDPFKVVTY